MDTFVYQLCLLAFTKYVSLRRLGFTMLHSIQDWVQFIKVQVNGCVRYNSNNGAY